MKSKLLLLFSFCLLFLGAACTKATQPTNPVLVAILTPIEAVGCSVEKAVVGVGASVLNAQCGAPIASATACLQSAIGNANICSVSGNASLSQFKTQGVVGNLACGYFVQFSLGLLTQAIPTSCGCTKNISATSFSAALTAACIAAVPI